MIYTLPCIAGHVGADTAGVILSEEPQLQEEMTLLVDVGTNAEILLGDKTKVLACSSPTGPAFEGAQISSGQRAAPGAIERLEINPETKEPRFRVIGSEIWSDEEGFDAIKSYVELNPYAASWMRPDAALLVVFVSDEDDQSDELRSATDFISWYSARRFGNVFLASIIMQEDDASVCDEDYFGSQPGVTYIEATNMLFGTVVDICADDWTPGVTDATSQIEPYESITLSKNPVPETIRVFVEQSLYSDWTFDQTTNTVHFTVIPPGGALVEVGYVINESA